MGQIWPMYKGLEIAALNRYRFSCLEHPFWLIEFDYSIFNIIGISYVISRNNHICN